VMEEGVVLRRGSLVLAPSEEKITVVLVPPFGTNFTPTLRNPGHQRSPASCAPRAVIIKLISSSGAGKIINNACQYFPPTNEFDL
jgi:hypothetical protein